MYNSDFNIQSKKTNLLLAAIGSREAARILQVIEYGADVDAEDGRPLRLCAENDDYKTAKLLFTKGADIECAIHSTEKDICAIPMSMQMPSIPEDPKEYTRYTKLNQTLERLKKYRQSLFESVLPQLYMQKLEQILQNQNRFAAKLEQFQRTLDEMTRDSGFDKDLPKSSLDAVIPSKGNAP